MLSYFAKEKISATLYRTEDGYYDTEGIWTPAVPVTSPVEIIAPQPLRADELKMFPEGERVYNHLKTWITSEVHLWPFIPADPPDKNPDIFKIDGFYYKIMQINSRNRLGNFYRVIMRETDYTPKDAGPT